MFTRVVPPVRPLDLEVQHLLLQLLGTLQVLLEVGYQEAVALKEDPPEENVDYVMQSLFDRPKLYRVQ